MSNDAWHSLTLGQMFVPPFVPGSFRVRVRVLHSLTDELLVVRFATAGTPPRVIRGRSPRHALGVFDARAG